MTSSRIPTTAKPAKKAATERIAAQRAAQQRSDRKHNLLTAGGGVLAVVLVIGGIVFAGLSSKKSTPALHPVVAATAAVTNAITAAVPLTSAAPDLSAVTAPKPLTGAALTGTSGKPEVLYIGAEFCPYCAVTRWPLAIALSRLGTLSNLQTTYSAANDAAGPNTPTLDFSHATYKSDYIDFTGIEYEDGAQKVIATLTPQQASLFQSVGGGFFPFIDFGGKWLQSGASYPTATLAGLTPDEVAAQIPNSSSKIGSTIQAGANVFTAAICSMDGGKPASVCTATGVTAAATALASLTK